MNAELIKRYFELTDQQADQFNSLFSVYKFWNEKINVISRKDIEHLYLHHVLHSLSIIKCYEFASGAEILDLGTGGGFPGIPLAIMNPMIRGIPVIPVASRKLAPFTARIVPRFV